MFELDLCPSKRVTQVPQCITCCKPLTNDGMRPTRWERHLKMMHPAQHAKPKAFFETKRKSLKQAKMDSSGAFRQNRLQRLLKLLMRSPC